VTADGERLSVSGFPIAAVHEPDGGAPERIGRPGAFPYTRGVHPGMYRERPWTMRQYSGFSSAEESNRRYRYLLEQGTTGLSVAFDLPTQMGYDSEAPIAEGEVGKVGVPIDTVEDMHALFDGIPLDDVSTSMTINAPASLLLLMYDIVASERGIDAASLRGTIQNDVLKEYIARGTYIFPPAPSLRLTADTFVHCAEHLPRFNTISISGYHMAEAGATPVQEVAFTLANAIAYLEAARDAGLDVDAVAPQMSFFFVARTTLLEEVAKFRAARRLWAHLVRDRFGARDERSMMLRFHTQTAGVQLTAQQPEVNLARVTVQALAAALGGTQSLHTNSYDEAMALPTEHSARLALRTQQVLAHETDVTATVDPFAGSYVVEAMTDAIEAAVLAEIERIDAMGGAVRGIEDGYQKREIERTAYEHARRVDSGEQVIVGVNRYTEGATAQPKLQRVDESVRAEQIARTAAVRATRDASAVAEALGAVDRAARGTDNLLPPMREALRLRATLQEVCDVLRAAFGTHTPGAGI
jgi:methylmalonyl-CoA mutase N-terminal domain/subunit